MTDFDIIIIHGSILPKAGKQYSHNGHIGIKDGIIKHIEPTFDSNTVSARTTIDARGHLICPGLVNAHCHSAMTLFRGLADDLPLMTWLNDHIFPAEAEFVTSEMVYWCTKLAAAEMIMAGITTVADGYFFESQAATAFSESGLRSICAQGVIDFPAPGVPDPKQNIAYAEAYLQDFPELHLSHKALFCHSPYTCSPATLERAKNLAVKHNCLLFIHAAETQEEVRQVQEKYGTTPVRHLKNLGVLDSSTLCVHCVAIDEEEIDILKTSQCAVVTCPQSNMKLASGVAPVPQLLDAGIPLALGTDGCASNNDLDMFTEMDSLAKLHKVSSSDPTVIDAGKTLAIATYEGAQALHLNKTGELSPGMQADIILINLNQPHLTPFYNPDNLVYCAKGSDVVTSIIGGKLVMHDKKVLSFDIEETMEHVRNLSKPLTKLAKSFK